MAPGYWGRSGHHRVHHSLAYPLSDCWHSQSRSKPYAPDPLCILERLLISGIWDLVFRASVTLGVLQTVQMTMRDNRASA